MVILPFVTKYRHRRKKIVFMVKKNNFLKNIDTTITIKLQSQSKYLAHLIVFSPSHSPLASSVFSG